MSLMDIGCQDNIIQTLTLAQLLLRPLWQGLSIQNVLEIARNGFFGLYFNPCSILGGNPRKSYSDLKIMIKNVMNSNNYNDKKMERNVEFFDSVVRFFRNNKHLIKHRPGYVRLSTDEECEIIRACERGSVKNMIIKNEIRREGLSCAFGFEFMRPYLDFPKKMLYQYFNLEDKIVTSDDLIVFVDQIEEFEANSRLSESFFKYANIALIGERQLQKMEDDFNSSEYTASARNFINVNNSTIEITFENVRIPPFKKLEGIEYLAFLLRDPRKMIHCSELYNLVHGVHSAEVPSLSDHDDPHLSYAGVSHQEQADDKYCRNINEGIKKIDEQITEAEYCGKFDKIEDLEETKRKLQNHLSNCSYRGRRKTFTDSSDRRLSVKNSIDRALKLIKKESTLFHEHLTQYLKTGHNIIYTANTQWSVTLSHSA